MATYQLLRGSHAQGRNEDNSQKVFKARVSDKLQEGFSDIVESEVDLVKKFGGDKFRRLDSDDYRVDTVEESTEDETDETDLASLTVAQLKELAEEEGVHLPSGANKSEIIEAIVLSQAE